jgi:RHH-type proline utilization regulon transcriptional repressor/proline dehydrogenase/delta 1-pyrroline-5-carboxylate dehydrogenase
MGGKNAVIIDEDADLDQAVAGVVTSAFGYAGQKCSACSRLVIVGSAYEPVLERLGHAIESLIVGPPHEPSTFVPPVISADAQDRIMGYMAGGREYAHILAQARTPSDGCYVPPTAFVDVPLDSPLAREEIFGPVLSVFLAGSFEEALKIATDSHYISTARLPARWPAGSRSAAWRCPVSARRPAALIM